MQIPLPVVAALSVHAVRAGRTGVKCGFCILRTAPLVQRRTLCTRGRNRAAAAAGGLSPRAKSIKVLTATAVSTMAGKAHAVAGVYPMASIRSRRARKLTENAPAPMVAKAVTAHR